MIGSIVEYADLQRITGYQRLSDVERCLTSAGVRFMRSKGGVWTTIDLINAAGGLAGKEAAPSETYSPELAA